MSVQFSSPGIPLLHRPVNNRNPLFAGGNSGPANADSFTGISASTKQGAMANKGKVLGAAFKDALKPGGFGIFHRPFGGWKRDIAQSAAVAILTPFTIPMIPFWLGTGALYRFGKTLIKGMRNPDSGLKP